MVRSALRRKIQPYRALFRSRRKPPIIAPFFLLRMGRHEPLASLSSKAPDIAVKIGQPPRAPKVAVPFSAEPFGLDLTSGVSLSLVLDEVHNLCSTLA